MFEGIAEEARCIPISGFELASKMGVKMIPFSSLTEEKLGAAKTISPDGFYCEPGNGREYIFNDDQKEYTRCNMTILHEIGHAVLGHTDETDPDVAEAKGRLDGNAVFTC